MSGRKLNRLARQAEDDGDYGRAQTLYWEASDAYWRLSVKCWIAAGVFMAVSVIASAIDQFA